MPATVQEVFRKGNDYEGYSAHASLELGGQ